MVEYPEFAEKIAEELDTLFDMHSSPMLPDEVSEVFDSMTSTQKRCAFLMGVLAAHNYVLPDSLFTSNTKGN